MYIVPQPDLQDSHSRPWRALGWATQAGGADSDTERVGGEHQGRQMPHAEWRSASQHCGGSAVRERFPARNRFV